MIFIHILLFRQKIKVHLLLKLMITIENVRLSFSVTLTILMTKIILKVNKEADSFIKTSNHKKIITFQSKQNKTVLIQYLSLVLKSLSQN